MAFKYEMKKLLSSILSLITFLSVSYASIEHALMFESEKICASQNADFFNNNEIGMATECRQSHGVANEGVNMAVLDQRSRGTKKVLKSGNDFLVNLMTNFPVKSKLSHFAYTASYRPAPDSSRLVQYVVKIE